MTTIAARAGDVILSGRDDYTAPEWLPCDGTSYPLETYPQLDPFFEVGAFDGLQQKLTNPAVLPAGTGRGTAFSPAGTYLAVAHDATPFVTIYKGEPVMRTPVLPAASFNTNYFVKTGESA
jgi:hypothetical protein